MKYAEYLKSRTWKKRREQAMRYAEFRCQVCNSNNMLETHHNTYENLGHEKPRDLVVLCDSCHELYRAKMLEPWENLATIPASAPWPAVRMEDGTIRKGRDAEVIGRWK